MDHLVEVVASVEFIEGVSVDYDGLDAGNDLHRPFAFFVDLFEGVVIS